MVRVIKVMEDNRIEGNRAKGIYFRQVERSFLGAHLLADT